MNLHRQADQPQRHEEPAPDQPSAAGHPFLPAINSLFSQMDAAAFADRWRAALDAVPDLIMLCDEHGTITYKNAACFALGHGRGTAGLSDRDAPTYQLFWQDGSPISPEDRPLRRAITTGEQQHQIAVRLRVQESEERLLVWNAVPLRDEVGNLTGAVAVGRDITNDHTLTQAREDWLAIAAHDLRSPVTAILGHLQLAHRVLSSAESAPDLSPEGAEQELQARRQMVSRLKRHLDVAEARTHDLMRRMEAILLASAARDGALSLQPAEGGVNLTSLARQAAQHIRTLTTRHTLVIQAPRRPVLVAGDPDLLRQVLDNLLANAVKYAPDGGQITISLQETAALPSGQAEPRASAPDLQQKRAAAHSSKRGKQRWALLRVADQGLGIPPADLPYVFERFRRAGGAARRVRGSGLGLYICRAIVEAHQGHVWVERTAAKVEQPDSQENDRPADWYGTVIAIALPLA